jgi:signal transduction histidine kinase
MVQKNITLRAKLMFIFLLLALVPLVAMGWFSVKSTEALIGNMVFRQLENAAVDKIALLEHWLNERKADLTVIAETSLVKSMDPERMDPYLDLIRRQYGVYKDLTVVSATGRAVAASRSKDAPRPAGAPAMLKVSESLVMSDITYAPEEQESTFNIGAPVRDDAGKLLGTVYGRVGTNRIVFFILNVSLGKTGECYLVDKDGRFLAHRDPARILTQNISQTGSFKNIFQERDKKEAYLDYRGIEVLGTSLSVSGTDWYIVVEQDKEEAFYGAKILKRIVYLTIFLGIACAMMLTWIISYHIVKPIRVLSKHAESMAEASLDETLFQGNRNDEIGMLYRAFHNMFLKVKERQNDLEHKVELTEAELKETDSMLRKTQLIAERSERFAAMGRMGAAVAHEIRTPLTSLKLFMESAQDQMTPSPEDAEDFQIAMKQIKRIEGTINRFLDFTKPRDLVFSEMETTDLLEDALFMFKPLVNRQECTLTIDLEEHLPKIFGDRKLLAEALINLLVNALEAVSDHGTVSVSCYQDHPVQDGVKVPAVRIDISDTGPGIPEDRMENIFEPFFTTKASGTGLGLPLVLNTVKSHGGFIRVQSRIRQGTTFSVFLPLNAQNTPLDEDHGKHTDH